VPGVVPGATVIKPVVVLRVIAPVAGGLAITPVVKVALGVAPVITTGVLLVVSLAVTNVLVTPPVAGMLPAGIRVVAVSTTAVMLAVTVTVSVTLAQLGVGLARSHSLYLMLYTPGGVAAVVLIAPVVVFKVMPAGKAGPVASRAIVELAAVAATPLTKSLLRMLAIGVAAVPASAVPVSKTGSMTALTTTVEVVLEQVAGVVAGKVQMVYGTL
jgi:hypothetical protein